MLEEAVPSSGFELATKVQKGLGIVFETKHPSPLSIVFLKTKRAVTPVHLRNYNP
jgi:hypothetical protein